MEPEKFLEYIVKELVDNPNDVKVTRTVDEMGVLLTLDLNPADMGKVIGRAGRTAKAVRTLLRVMGIKHNARVNMKINEPAGMREMLAANSGAAAEDDRPAIEIRSAQPTAQPVDAAAITAEMDAALEELKADF